LLVNQGYRLKKKELRKYDFCEFQKDIIRLSKDIASFNPETIVAITRGGLTLAHSLSQALNIRDVQTISAVSYSGQNRLSSIKVSSIPNIIGSRVLVVDDISDSGRTLDRVMKTLANKYPKCKFKTATIFYKIDSIFYPDFKLKETKEWIEFFWEF
jgi:xanthine phosphoribosyltransferase